MKALLALLTFAAALPLPFYSDTPTEPVPGAGPVAVAEIPLDEPEADPNDPPPCDGCEPQLRLVLVTPPPSPCQPWENAIHSFKVVPKDGHRKGDCGICVDPQRNICEFDAQATCSVNATVQITLKPGFNFHPTLPTPIALRNIIGTPKCAGQPMATGALQVYNDTCPFAIRVEYRCSECNCPIPAGDA